MFAVINEFWMFSDVVILFNEKNQRQARIQLEASAPGLAIRRLPDGTYVEVFEGDTVLDVLKSIGNYSVFIKALEVWFRLKGYLLYRSMNGYERWLCITCSCEESTLALCCFHEDKKQFWCAFS